MTFSALVASAFGEFMKNNFVWIIVALTIIIVIVIILVTLKMKKKPSVYQSDEIDASVDKAAREKAQQRIKAEFSENKSSNPVDEQANVDKKEKISEKEIKSDPQKEAKPENSEPVTEVREIKEKESDQKDNNLQKETKKDPSKRQDQKDAKDEQKKPAPQKTQVKEQKPMAKEQKPEADEEESKRPQSYRILYDKETETWEVRKDNAKRVIRRVKTKKEALEIAKELSQNQDLNLVVHKKDGKFQKKR